MKYIVIAIIVIILVAAGFFAGRKIKDDKTSPTPTPTVTSTQPPVSAFPTTIPTVTPTPSQTPSLIPTYTMGPSSGNVGNRVGDIAPDFQLYDINGAAVSLRSYRGEGEIQVIFKAFDQVILHTNSGQDITLRDPESNVHRLYNAISMPYTVTINSGGIITAIDTQ